MKKLIVLMVMMLTVLVAGESATAYEKGKSYTAGDRVYSSGHVYVCKVAGWCSQTAYEPALSLHWRNAWEDRGEGTLEGEAPSHNQTAAWKANHHYSSGDTIRYQEKTYICKGYPYTPWCSQRAPGTNGWREAWEEHEAQVTQDTIPPVITLHGEATMTLEQNVVYTELGATALDDVDGNVSVTISGTVNTAVVGTYTLTYMAQDSAGNEANITRTITVIDVTPPVITLNGESTITLEQHAVYTELGATALDGVDGNVSVTISGNVDTSTVGSFTVTYSATDGAGNEANVTRTITIIDVTPPVIMLNGEANITLEQNAVYTELGATALDAVDGNISVIISGTVDTSTIGNYTVMYTAQDSAGNEANLTRTVRVTDVTPPSIILNGDENITIVEGGVYEELGATASDTVDENISVSINGTVDTTTIGEYILTYTATDSSGNSASVSRTVNVKSNEPTLESLVLSTKQTSFIRKKEPNSDYYTRVREPVTVMGIYSDGHSEDVTDNVIWSGERYGKVIKVQSGYLFGGILEKTKGLVTLTASIGDIKSNTLNIDVENEQEERLLLVDISNKNKIYYKNRDASIYLDLVYKPTSDVKLRFKLKESDGVKFENGSLDTEIIFSPSDTRFDSHYLRLVDRDINNTNPYTITTEVFESNDARYGGKKPKDIVVEPSKINLLVPSIEGRRGAIRGVPITFSVLSKHLSLKYTLVDAPKGMKIIEDYNPHNNAGGMPHIGGVNVEWNVPMDIEEKIYTITMKAVDLEGNTAEVSFDIKVPQTKIIPTKVVNNELIVTDKSSLLYGMKMKGHNGEDISSLKLRSVAYADVWKKKIKDKKPEDVVERTVFILDNMPDKLDVKMPEYMDTFKERINIGMRGYKYNERMYDYAMSFDPWDPPQGEIYLYENTNGLTLLHKDTEYEKDGSKVFLHIIKKSQNIGK